MGGCCKSAYELEVGGSCKTIEILPHPFKCGVQVVGAFEMERFVELKKKK